MVCQDLLDPIEPSGTFGDSKELLEILALSLQLFLCQEPGPAQQHRHSTRTLMTLSGVGAESLNISP